MLYNTSSIKVGSMSNVIVQYVYNTTSQISPDIICYVLHYVPHSINCKYHIFDQSRINVECNSTVHVQHHISNLALHIICYVLQHFVFRTPLIVNTTSQISPDIICYVLHYVPHYILLLDTTLQIESIHLIQFSVFV
jgi:hypothetical protein